MPSKSLARPRGLPVADPASPATVRALAREVGAAIPASEQQPFAEAFCREAVAAYWTSAFGSPLPEPLALSAPLPLNDWASRQAGRLGSSLGGAPDAAAAYALGVLYSGLIPEERRSRHGVYYTPPAIAVRLLEMVEREGIRWESARVLDPAAGGGAFMAPVAAKMAGALSAFGATPIEVLHHVERNLRGIELDPFAAWMSEVFLQVALRSYCTAAGRPLDPVVVVGDALGSCRDSTAGFDLVVGNPPYGRITPDARTRERFSRSIYGHANLYGIFMDLAVRLTKPGGRIAFVTPASFLGGQYFKRLRQVLTAEAPPLALDFLRDRSGVFDEVLQETVLVVLGRGSAVQPVDVCATSPSPSSGPCQVTRLGRVPMAAASDEPWILPRNLRDAALLDRAREMPHRLRDLGLEVNTGPLVWNRHKDQLAASPGADRHPLLWAESILPGGGFSFRARRRNHQPYFSLRPGQNHLLLHGPAVLVQRTTAKEQTRRLAAAVLPAEFVEMHDGVVVENHVNVIRPRDRAGAPLRAVAALLNSAVVDRLFRCISGSVAVSAYELAALPLPPPAVLRELDTLIDTGANSDAIERFLRGVYGERVEALA